MVKPAQIVDIVSRAKTCQELADLWDLYQPKGLWSDEVNAAALVRSDELRPTAEAPRCRMCARPARWLTTQDAYAAYCSGKACSNRDRICQKCGGPFVLNVDGAGTKYCSVECKAAGYQAANHYARQETCAWCGQKSERQKTRRNRVWPFICEPCLEPIRYVVQRLRNHHVPHERARQLLTDSGCEICGLDLLAVVLDPRTGKPTSPLVVDHDHTCCPGGSYSCGTCVRGLLCSNCNAAAGLLRDDPKYAQSLASYLARSIV